MENTLKKIRGDGFEAFESVPDTEFLGFPCARAVLYTACTLPQHQKELFKFLDLFEFNTIVNQGNSPINNHWLGEGTRAFLTDVNIQLSKKLSASDIITDDEIGISDNHPEDDQIIGLAKVAFTVSRFLNDPYLYSGKAIQTYADIAQNAFRKKGRFYITRQVKGLLMGFLLFSINEDSCSATIELVAADKNQTRRGIGRSLLRAMEAFLIERQVKTMNVGTQLDNLDALRLYTSYGFRILECNSVYHYWPRGPYHGTSRTDVPSLQQQNNDHSG